MQKVRNLVYLLGIGYPLQETILEGLRWAFFAGLSAAITFLIGWGVILPNPEVWILVLTLVGRLIDRYKYYDNKEESRGKNTLGLIF